MKITELELNKIYKPNNYEYTHNIYRMTNSGLEYKFEDDEQVKDDLSFNELFTYEFIEFEREIDWNRVPKWTKVQVRDNDKHEWVNRYFIGVNYGMFSLTHPFVATMFDEFIHDGFECNNNGYRYCRIHPSIEIKEEWYKDYVEAKEDDWL